MPKDVIIHNIMLMAFLFRYKPRRQKRKCPGCKKENRWQLICVDLARKSVGRQQIPMCRYSGNERLNKFRLLNKSNERMAIVYASEKGRGIIYNYL